MDRQMHLDVSLPLEVLGLVLLVLFAGTFGMRWAVLALALIALFVGTVLSGVRITVQLPGRAAAGAPPEVR